MKDKEKIIQRLYGNEEIDRISKELKCLGSTKYNVYSFCIDRLICSLLVFIIILFSFRLGYIFAPFLTLAFYQAFYYVFITKKKSNRDRKLEHEALYFFEILALTLESGRNLENALEVTCDNVDSEISLEFKNALDEMKYGKSLIEALGDLKELMSSDIINNIILNIIQTSQFGNSILDTLYNEVDFLRQKELLSVKEKINKIPNKVSIISVLFIVPLIIILILGPYLIKVIG